MEFYMAVALSTAHLTLSDCEILDKKVEESAMVMKRNYGWFIKLYSDADDENPNPNFDARYSQGLTEVIQWAVLHGFKMIEFDCDVEPDAKFATHQW